MKSAFLVSKGLLCLYDKQNNTWLLVDMEFLFSCSTRHLTRSLRSLVSYRVKHSKRNSISTRAHVSFSPALTCWPFAINMISIANCHVALKRSRASQDFIRFYVYLLDQIVVLIQFLKDYGSMITVKNYRCGDTSCHTRVRTILWRPVSKAPWIMHSTKFPGQPLVFMESVIYARSNPNCGLTQAVGLRDSL